MNEKQIEIVKKIAKQLADYDQLMAQLSSESNTRVIDEFKFSPWDACTLSHGIPALCMLYGELAEQFPDEGWEVIGNEYLKRLVKGIEEGELDTISMFSGASGIALSILCMSHNGILYKKLRASLRQYIIVMGRNILNYDNKGGMVISVYDGIEGISGILNYLLLEKEEAEVFPFVQDCVQFLINITHDIEVNGESVPGWYVPAKYQFSQGEKSQFPQGNFNTSISHGIAGIILALCSAYQQGIRLAGQEEAVMKMVSFLKRFMSFDGESYFWKGQISYEEFQMGYANEENIVRRDAWCYGNIGICYAMIRSGTVFDKPALRSEGTDILRRTLQDIKGVFSPTFCHGYSGIYAVLEKVEELCGKNLFTLEKKDIMDKIMEYYEPDYVYGFYNHELDQNGSVKKYEYIGLLDGVSGICLTLLAAELPVKTMWKRAFFL